MKLERLYKELEKKFNRYFKLSCYFNGKINNFTFSPYLGLRNDDNQEIIVKLISNEEELREFIKVLEKDLEIKLRNKINKIIKNNEKEKITNTKKRL